MVGIHSSYYAFLYHPGYTTMCTYHRVHCSTGTDVQDGNTLGSKREKGLGENLPEG